MCRASGDPAFTCRPVTGPSKLTFTLSRSIKVLSMITCDLFVSAIPWSDVTST